MVKQRDTHTASLRILIVACFVGPTIPSFTAQVSQPTFRVFPVPLPPTCSCGCGEDVMHAGGGCRGVVNLRHAVGDEDEAGDVALRPSWHPQPPTACQTPSYLQILSQPTCSARSWLNLSQQSQLGPWVCALRGGGVASSAKRRARELASQQAREKHDGEGVGEGARVGEGRVAKKGIKGGGAGESEHGGGGTLEHALVHKGGEQRLSKKNAAEAALSGSLSDRLQLLVGSENERDLKTGHKMCALSTCVLLSV